MASLCVQAATTVDLLDALGESSIRSALEGAVYDDPLALAFLAASAAR